MRSFNAMQHFFSLFKVTFCQLLPFITYFLQCASTSTVLPEANLTTVEIIEYYGYPVETHRVTTIDGYILEMHRIPGGKNDVAEGVKLRRESIFLQHGLVGSSAVWVTNMPNHSAGFIFADAGYDVWMGNARGNKYSNKHEKYSSSDREFWEFTWSEISEIDLDAMIMYVLKETQSSSLYYVGYSEGTITMFAKLVTDQSFASKIKKFFALGPIGTLAHIRGLIKVAAEKFLQPLEILVKLGGEFMPNSSLFGRMSKALCSVESITSHCENIMFQMTGPDTSQMNETRIPIYMSHLPAGTSVVNIHHWAQMANSRKMQMYDLGSAIKNNHFYGSDNPPTYNLSLINVPVYLFWSNVDWLATKQDVQESLIDVIPSEYLIKSFQLANFNHFDFIWGKNAPKEIYRPILRIMADESE